MSNIPRNKQVTGYMRHRSPVTMLFGAMLMVLALLMCAPVPARADGLGITGNFYRQHYELSPGETTEGSDVYVIVTNSAQTSVRARIHTQTPSGVTLLLSDNDFTLEPGGQRKVTINVQIDPDAVPGDYTIAISAEAFREGTGIKVTTGVQQEARLSILGESGLVTLYAVNEKGDPFPASVGIYRNADSQLTLVRPPQAGQIKSRLVPGDYIAQAHVRDIKVAEESFSLASNEEKTITLVCDTLVVSKFSAVPLYSVANKLLSVKITYAIENLDQPVDDVRVVLEVSVDGQSLDEAEITSFSTLDPGSRGGSYNYIPAQGWQEGNTYEFAIRVYAGDELQYVTTWVKPNEDQSSSPASLPSPNQKTPVSSAALPASHDDTGSPRTNWPLIVGIIGGVAVVLGTGMFFRLRKRPRY